MAVSNGSGASGVGVASLVCAVAVIQQHDASNARLTKKMRMRKVSSRTVRILAHRFQLGGVGLLSCTEVFFYREGVSPHPWIAQE